MKRRVTGAGSEGPAKAQKRRRVSSYVPETDETPEGTTKAGLELLDQIKEAVDKYGRPVATEFLELPDPKEHPDYYKAIRLPISLAMIEKRLKNHEYPRMTPVESDLRRMIGNAKFYNEKGSLIFSNAERIRKIVVGAMPDINPAYKDPNYAPFPTPVPDSEEEGQTEPAEEADAQEPEAEESTAQETPQGRRQSSNRPSTAERGVDADATTNDSFEGCTLEAAQEKILSEMIRMKDEDGEEVFLPFINKPDRNLYKEYYDIIKHPVSLRSILKMVRGTDRRKGSQKHPFRTWSAFEEEMSYLWKNAREFNEEGSDIVALAGRLEEHFYRRLEEAKKLVPESPPVASEPPPPRLKLKMGGTKTPEATPQQKITLRLPGRTEQTSSKMENLENGVTVDSEALRRQQELVRAGSSGLEPPSQTPSRNLRSRSGSGPRTRATSSASRLSQAPGGPSPLADNIKPEMSAPQTPNLAAIAAQPRANGTPATPLSHLPQETIGEAATQPAAPSPSLQGAQTRAQSSQAADTKQSNLSRDIRQALIRNINISTPFVPEPRRLVFNIPPSPNSLTQTVTINLPSSHHVISILTTAAASSLQRQTGLSVSVEKEKVNPNSPQSPVPNTDAFLQRYDVRLGTGITRIDVDMVAAPGRGLAHLSFLRGPGVQCERVTIFANVMRT
ncbi:hypothetical protein VTO42DRAFT_6585 [Malbranchea cinnamomea]